MGPSLSLSLRACAGDLLAAWNVLRAFSWQLRLSPFGFQDLCAAMASQLVGVPAVSPTLICSCHWE